MKKRKKKIEKTSVEYSDRSPLGLWVRGVLTETAIDVFWKPRFHYEKSVVTVFDFNGEVEKEIPAAEIEWGDEWRSAGSVELVDEMVEIAGLEHFEAFTYGLMKHIVRLIVCGYGEDPGEVISWFENLRELEFVQAEKYFVGSEHGLFEGMTGVPVYVDRYDDGTFDATIQANEARFDFDFKEEGALASFVISAYPAL